MCYITYKSNINRREVEETEAVHPDVQSDRVSEQKNRTEDTDAMPWARGRGWQRDSLRGFCFFLRRSPGQVSLTLSMPFQLSTLEFVNYSWAV